MKLNRQSKDNVQLDKEDLVKNSLIGDYLKYIVYLERHNWTRDSITITESLSNIVTINTLKVGHDGTVIDIKCPAGLIISIPGIDGLPNDYNIERIRPIEIKLSNSSGKEIDQNTCIGIFKHKMLKKDVKIEDVLYMDISMTDYSDSPNLFKDYSKLYRFKKGIEIKGEDSMKIHVINPDIDIDKIQFNIGVDLWNESYQTDQDDTMAQY